MQRPGIADSRQLADSWQAVLGRLEIELNKHNYNTWLKGSRALGINGTELVVEAKSALHCNHINQTLIISIQNVATRFFGEEVRVRFVPKGAETAPAVPGPELAGEASMAGTPRPVLGSINCDFSFEHYLAGEGNQFALSACKGLLDDDAAGISPVVIYGAPGMGKTHLLHALACAAVARGRSVACLTAEQFTSAYMNANRTNTQRDFQLVIRNVQLLIIDDLQYLEGKGGTQGELVAAMEAITNAGGQIVVASECDPANLDLLPRLISRLNGGVHACVEPFGLAERRAFIEQSARRLRASLPSWAVNRVAACEAPSVRVLQGAVHSAVTLLRNESLDLRRLDAALTRLSVVSVHPSVLEERSVLETIARYFDLTLEDLTGPSRKPAVRDARAIAIAALSDLGRNNSAIADILARERSTISQTAARGRKLLEATPELGQLLAG